jgi:hypothetical protein
MSASTFGSASPVFTWIARDAVVAANAVSALLARAVKFFSIDGEQRERERREDYLAESADRYQLEYRMRELDRAEPQQYWLTGRGR